MKAFTVSKAVTALMLAGLVLLPLYSQLSGNIFILTLFTRIVILALAAASLNLIMGFGGMMSFGHAAYLGIGGYAVGMLAQEGVGSGFIQFPVALAAARAGRRRLRLHPVPGRARGFRDLCAGDRRALASYAWRLLHHDHAGVCADGLLRRLGPRTLRRR
ncbi:hypothetical protein ABIF44_005143 [Bradyrhizobium japonicum]